MALRGKNSTSCSYDFNNGTIEEQWQCNWSDVFPLYELTYPLVGDPHESFNNFICSQIKINPEPQWYSDGAQVCTLNATFTVDYKSQENAYSIKISSGGYQTFKMYAGGVWNGAGIAANAEQSDLEYKLPIINMNMATRVLGEVNYQTYEAKIGKINSTQFYNRNIGTVLFDSYNITPKFANGIIIETELSLDFKILPIDWNYEYRQPMQFRNSNDNQKAYWQNSYPSRFDYTVDPTKVGQPIWSGEISGYGNPVLGIGAWDYRVFKMAMWDVITSTWIEIERAVYEYADFSDL